MAILWGKAHENKKLKFLSTFTPPMLGGEWECELDMEEGRSFKFYITKQSECLYQVGDLYICKNIIDALNFDSWSKFLLMTYLN